MKWHKESIDNVLVKEIAQEYNISLLEASVLVRRGITRGEDILFFLETDFVYLHTPFLFKDMEVAIDRIKQAQEENEKVFIFGDMDVDGMTSTTILVRTLQERNIDTIWKVPVGQFSYGLLKQEVDYAHQQGATLIITVDCGISNIEETEYANSLGIDMIILDHHVPSYTLPDALAIIDPKVISQKYPFDGMCAAAVAQKFRLALAISETPTYNNDVVLLNVVPLNDSYKIELFCVRNLVKQWDKSLTVSTDDVLYQLDQLVQILEGKQIVVYNKQVQMSLIQQIFGNLEFYALDLQELVAKHFSVLANKSLLQISDSVRLVKYVGNLDEIDIFFKLYKSVIYAEFPSIKESFHNVSDLVAIATIADMMPLVGENRIFYKIGIKKMTENPDANLQCLMDMLKLKRNGTLDSRAIGWSIAPVINSAGRMGQANLVVELFLSENTSDACKYAEQIIQLNQDRKKQMNLVKNTIKEEVEKNINVNKHYALIYSEELPYAFTGIVAGQYSRQYNKPVIIIAKKEDGTLNGSIRCPAVYNAPSLIQQLESYLIDGGGHKAAAGFSLHAKYKDDFISDLEELLKAKENSCDHEESPILVDLEVPSEYFTPNDIKSVQQRFEPYGEGWQTINMLFSHVSIYSCETVGKNSEHIKLIVNLGKYKVPAFLWAYDDFNIDYDVFKHATQISFVAIIKLDVYQGIDQLSLIIQDWEIENAL